MISENAHPRIAAVEKDLAALSNEQLDRPSAKDRDALRVIRATIRKMIEETGTGLNEQNEADLSYLDMLATAHAKRQERYFEKNGNKWATP